MEKDKEKNIFDQFFVEEDEDISESIDYLKHVFGSVMDVIFGEDQIHDKHCKSC